MTVPLTRQFTFDQTSLAATTDVSGPMFRAPWAGQVTLVEFIPAQTQAADTAVAATLRTYTLYNRGAAGTGTTALAKGALTSLVASQTAFGTGFLDGVASSIPLTTTALLTVASGDIIEWESSHSGGTGLRDVGGKVVVTLSRI